MISKQCPEGDRLSLGHVEHEKEVGNGTTRLAIDTTKLTNRCRRLRLQLQFRIRDSVIGRPGLGLDTRHPNFNDPYLPATALVRPSGAPTDGREHIFFGRNFSRERLTWRDYWQACSFLKRE